MHRLKADGIVDIDPSCAARISWIDERKGLERLALANRRDTPLIRRATRSSNLAAGSQALELD